MRWWMLAGWMGVVAPAWALDWSPAQLARMLEAREEGKAHFVLVDVRTPEEHAAGMIAGTDLLLPVQVLAERYTVLLDSLKVDPETDTVVVYCRSGRRAEYAKGFLRKKGFKHVLNAGGIKQWVQAGYELAQPASSSSSP